jgi:HD-GYP domain-containing protein (c-di-GMP phosphodiesterase class II)
VTAGVAEAPWIERAVQMLARELRLHHAPTADHSHRLASLCRAIAERLGLDPIDSTEVEIVAVLHDVGKLTIEPELLDYPGPLDDRQRRRMRKHTIEGQVMLAQTAGLEHLASDVRATHEAWDGSGYPDGLSGPEIPLAARIVAVADSYDAMVNDRAYRPRLPKREAMRRIRAGAGMQFDPDVATALLAVVRSRS